MEKFLLDPDYRNYKHGQTPIKVSTVVGNEMSFNFHAFMTALFIGLILLIGSFLFRDFQFATRGVETEADVLDCEFRDAVGRSGPSLAVTYRYVVAGEPRTGTEAISPGDYSCASLPQTLQIKYLDASQSRIVDQRVAPTSFEQTAVQILFGTVIAIMLIGVLFFISSMFKYSRARACVPKLQQTGTVINGEIVKFDLMPVGTNNQMFTAHVTYRFTSPTGATLSRKQVKRRDDLKGQPIPPAGTPVTVIYADENCHAML